MGLPAEIIRISLTGRAGFTSEATMHLVCRHFQRLQHLTGAVFSIKIELGQESLQAVAREAFVMSDCCLQQISDPLYIIA